MFRYQVGLVCLTLAVIVAVRCAQERRFVDLAGLACGGAIAALAQGLVDLNTHGAWFASLINYVRFNESESSRYGRAPWFTYLLDFIALTLPPATIWLAKPMWRAAKAHIAVSVSFAVFVLAHSVVPHKEEHFIFAVLPYFFVVLGVALLEVPHFPRVWFWAVNTVALALVTVSDGHESLTRPLLAAGRDGGFRRVYFVGPLLTPDFYLGRRVELRRVGNAGQLINELAGETVQRVRIIFERAPDDDTVHGIEASGFGCAPPEVSHGDIVDQLLVLVNPVNRRRGEKTVIDCWRR